MYDNHILADDAVQKLATDGIDMRSISIVGKGYHSEEPPAGFFNAGERTKFFGKLAAFRGGLAGLLFGSAPIFVPVALGGDLSAPKDSVLRYETAFKADKFLVIVHAENDQVLRARELLVTEIGTQARAQVVVTSAEPRCTS